MSVTHLLCRRRSETHKKARVRSEQQLISHLSCSVIAAPCSLSDFSCPPATCVPLSQHLPTRLQGLLSQVDTDHAVVPCLLAQDLCCLAVRASELHDDVLRVHLSAAQVPASSRASSAAPRFALSLCLSPCPTLASLPSLYSLCKRTHVRRKGGGSPKIFGFRSKNDGAVMDHWQNSLDTHTVCAVITWLSEGITIACGMTAASSHQVQSKSWLKIVTTTRTCRQESTPCNGSQAGLARPHPASR